MKAIQVHGFGGPDKLVLDDVKKPEPGEGEILVEVKAIGVNPVDTYIRDGTYPVLPELPYIPGKDVAGVVKQVGPGVSRWKNGERVYSSGTLSGAYASHCLCGQDQIFLLPGNVTFEQGAAVGVPGATAWRALFIRGEGKAGQRVLIHGASGSVGLAAVQLAKAAGLEVHGTAGTSEGLEIVRDAGAHWVFNHGEEGYLDDMSERAGDGYHLILEMLANKNLENDLLLLAPRGRVVVIGSRGRIEIDPRMTMGKETEIRGLALFNCNSEEMVRTHEALFTALESGQYVPRVQEILPLANASLAHEKVLKSGNCGKILLVP